MMVVEWSGMMIGEWSGMMVPDWNGMMVSMCSGQSLYEVVVMAVWSSQHEGWESLWVCQVWELLLLLEGSFVCSPLEG